MPQYRGLVNEGATCYLNSLIQILFMTPQFRTHVYQYIHDSRKIANVDSIPYQLQKLFVLLQLNESSVYTKGLRRSFQWDEANSFEQHDVQEFCRILFQALEKAHKGNNWIGEIYTGTVISRVSCGFHARENSQIFMDVSLPIRNLADNCNYRSLQQCLKEYLRPESISDYHCEECNKKVNIQKSMKFSSLPPILTLQLNRFEFNFQTQQRQKINSFVYFPEILEMQGLLMPYDQIQIKEVPADLQQKTKVREVKKSERMTDWGGLNAKGVLKRKNSDDIEVKTQKARFFDEENADKRTLATKQLTQEQEVDKNKQILEEMKAEREKLNHKFEKISQAKQLKTQTTKKDPLEDDMLFGTFMADVPKNFNAGSFEVGPTPKFETTQVSFEHEQQAFDPNQQYPPNTYVLFSILVHNGGAYGGHYFAYIFDGQDWFCFNDNNVKKVARSQIRKYGNPNEDASFGSNAYLLFYKQASAFKAQASNNKIEIPLQLIEKVKRDHVVQLKKEDNIGLMKQERYQAIGNKVLFKVYWPGRDSHQNGVIQSENQHEVIIMDDRINDTIALLRQKVKEVMQITQKDENWRIRRYNKSDDSFYEVYGRDSDHLSLESFGLRQTCNIGIETKRDEQEFQSYDPQNITVKLNMWRENLTVLTEKYLKPKKISIRDEKTYQQFYEKVEKVLGVSSPIILKRNFSSGNPYQIFKLEENKDRTLISLRFFNGINLYAEPHCTGQLKWGKEFKDQKYRCLIKFNHPDLGDEKDQELYIDTRSTLGDLKTLLASKIGIPFEEFRLKKSRQTVAEMNTYKKKLIDLRFINNEFLYLEKGKSSKGSLILKRGLAAIQDGQITYDLGEETQIELNSTLTTVADVKNILATKVDVSCFNIRIREYKAFQFGEIFRDYDPVQRLKEKSLVWEEIQEEDPHGKQIYVQAFDITTMELSGLHSIFMEDNASYSQLVCIFEEEMMIPKDKILAWKAPSNYIDRSMLLDVEWQQISFINKAIREEPLYINDDGHIIILKQAENAYHPKPQKKTNTPHDSSIPTNKKTEQALKITVVQENAIEEAEHPESQSKQGPESQIQQQTTQNNEAEHSKPQPKQQVAQKNEAEGSERQSQEQTAQTNESCGTKNQHASGV